MLKRLYIKDFAIVDELEIYFEPGFQVITGETGAGKSILVGAIGYLCGERASSDVLRAGAIKTIMETEFEIEYGHSLRSLLNDLQIEEQDKRIILRREINDKGVSRAFINDSPVNVNGLAQVSDYLVDLHGQHQHQRLLKQETHIEYLDEYGQLQPLLLKYSDQLQRYRSDVDQLSNLIKSREKVQEKQDLFKFQIDELEKANLNPQEYAELEQEKKILENSEILYERLKTVADLLYNNDESALKYISDARSNLDKVAEIDGTFKEFLQNLESARVTIEEIGLECEQYSTRLEFDPDRLEDIRNRLAELDWLMKKYQTKSTEELIDYLAGLHREISDYENFDDKIKQLSETIESERKKLQDLALTISEARKEIARKFEKEMNEALKSVGLANSLFTIKFEITKSEKGEVFLEEQKYLLNDRGMDLVEFYVGINVGESVKPLQKVASGGEVSRIMLCIKSLLADSDAIETLVFDEIDNGISGKYAQIVGKKMRYMSGKHQLIVITHLPQIAAQGDNHYSVQKFESNGRTKVQVEKLNPEQRIDDIAKLLGGDNITESTRASARELMQNTA